METTKAIITRRSVRQYQEKSISKEDVDMILRCAMSAPSAYHEEPWQFIVIDDKELLNKIPAIHPHAKMAPNAPLAILVCGDLRLNKTDGFWPQDCSAATQNLMLAAHDLGIGSVWTGIYPREDRAKDFQSLFTLPKEVIPFALIVLGYPASESKEEDRYKKERVHFNTWK